MGIGWWAGTFARVQARDGVGRIEWGFVKAYDVELLAPTVRRGVDCRRFPCWDIHVELHVQCDSHLPLSGRFAAQLGEHDLVISSEQMQFLARPRA